MVYLVSDIIKVDKKYTTFEGPALHKRAESGI